MTAKLALAATVLAAACGCAGNPPAVSAASTAAAGKGTYYCWKERLAAEGDGLVCNWETTASAACRSTSVTTIKRATVAGEPRNARLCDNGQWLVAVTMR